MKNAMLGPVSVAMVGSKQRPYSDASSATPHGSNLVVDRSDWPNLC